MWSLCLSASLRSDINVCAANWAFTGVEVRPHLTGWTRLADHSCCSHVTAVTLWTHRPLWPRASFVPSQPQQHACVHWAVHPDSWGQSHKPVKSATKGVGLKVAGLQRQPEGNNANPEVQTHLQKSVNQTKLKSQLGAAWFSPVTEVCLVHIKMQCSHKLRSI